jgi:sugar phosphate isomerase/epimerase
MRSLLTSAPTRIGGFLLGCQAWSFNHFSVYEAVEKTARAGGATIEFFPGQRLRPDASGGLGPETPDSELSALLAHCGRFGVTPVAFGVTGFGSDDTANRKTFVMAKRLGLLAITCEPAPDAYDSLERLVREFDIRIAIHNHPRRRDDASYRYWDPNYVLEMVGKRDPRLGACADLGHWVRSGIKPIDAVRQLRGRIHAVHLKDPDAQGADVPLGNGAVDIPRVLEELNRQKIDGALSLEYEARMEDNLAEVAQSLGFVRGWTLARGLR